MTGEMEGRWILRQKAGKVSTPPLGLVIQMLPTPSGNDAKNKGGDSQYRRNTIPLNGVCGPKTGLKLQPAFVEWMMGWPLGWTDLKPLAMAKFRQWLDWHGIF
jgi:DNA (cytosine-5)-methyltransferase 1